MPTASARPPNSAPFKPFGELNPAHFTPTQRIGYLASDALMGLGVKPYAANDLASRIGGLLGWTPLGIAGSALDLIDAKRRDDLGGAVTAAAGIIPGAKGVARGAVNEVRAGIRTTKGAEVQFAQIGISRNFHKKGDFKGRSIDDVVGELKSGALSPDQLPLKVVIRDGVTYTINNRSLMTLRLAGKEPTILKDVTGIRRFENYITERLAEIGSRVGPNFMPSIRK